MHCYLRMHSSRNSIITLGMFILVVFKMPLNSTVLFTSCTTRPRSSSSIMSMPSIPPPTATDDFAAKSSISFVILHDSVSAPSATFVLNPPDDSKWPFYTLQQLLFYTLSRVVSLSFPVSYGPNHLTWKYLMVHTIESIICRK